VDIKALKWNVLGFHIIVIPPHNPKALVAQMCQLGHICKRSS